MGRATGPLLALILASIGWAQSGPRVVGAADYSSGATTGIPRGSIFTITFPPGQMSLKDVAPTTFASPLPLSFEAVGVGVWTASSGGTLLAQAPLLYVSPTQINAVLPSSVEAGSYYLNISGVTLAA